jgi:hypothetical protein
MIIALAILLVFAVLIVAELGLVYSRNREVASGISTLNPESTAGAALVVYHPGRSDFQRRVFARLAEGLASRGWRVETTTASPQAPANVTSYDLLVVGGPTYNFAPSRPIRRYLKRAGDLDGLPTVTVTTGLGAGERASAILQDLVRRGNGTLVQALLLYKMRPNDDDNYVDAAQNRELAAEMAFRAGQQIPLPVRAP